MAQIVQFFTNIVLMLLGFFLCISITAGVFQSVRADEYKADVKLRQQRSTRQM